MSGRTTWHDSFPLDLREANTSGGLVQGVSVLGPESKNGRTYLRSAQEDVVEHIRGGRSTVFADHPDGRHDAVRPTASTVGVLENARLSGDTVKADLKVADNPPWNSLVPWLAEEAPTAAGLSIRARGEVREADDGRLFVESVDQLLAVELVTEPASVGALVESVQRDREERVREVLAESDLDGLVCLVEHLAAQPDGVERAHEVCREFEEIAARPASEETRPRTARLRRSGPRMVERDPDRLIQRGHVNGDGRDLGSISDDLFA